MRACRLCERALKQIMKKLAVFDIDGTLHKTEVMGWEAYRVVMPEFGLPMPTRAQMISTYGCNAEEILRILGIPPALSDAFYARIDKEEVVQMYRCGECYAGVLDMLHVLHKEGYQIALCSMCSAIYMDAFIRCFGLAAIVATGRNEDTSGPDKAILLKEILDTIAPDKAVMVGDRMFDIQAATKNGVPSIGCLYGYAPDEVREADAVASNAAELYQSITALLK